MRGFRFRSILYSERCAHICLAPYFLVVSTVGSKRRYHSDSCRFNTIGCWLFIYLCSEDLNLQFSSSRNRSLRLIPTSQDRFALRQLLWPDYSTTNLVFSSTKVKPSLHVISLPLRDRQWNELPAKFKITWRHSNRPIRLRPWNNHTVWHRTKNRLK